MSNARVEYSLKLLTVFSVGLAWLATGSLSAQTLGQPPVQACKPGDFTVVGYPSEFGPKAGANFPVLIDSKFEGEFLTTEKIWVPVIRTAVDKWNGIGGSDWSFTIEGFGGADGGDGKTTIAACGFTFTCPGEVPEPPGGEVPPGIPGTVAPQSIIAVTLIFGDDSLSDRIEDSDIFFNPELPVWTEPTNAQIDFESVLLHELGHALGQGHNDNCVVGPTIMESSFDVGEIRRTLSDSEKEGVQYLYPSSSSQAIRVFESDVPVRFEAVEGEPSPFPQTANIYGTRGGRWRATTSQPWLTVSAADGKAPWFLGTGVSAVDFIVDTSNLGGGEEGFEYGAVATFAVDGHDGPATNIEVSVNVSPTAPVGVAPFLTRQGIVNGANLLSQSLAPGSLFTLFGERLSGSTMTAGDFPLPETLDGTQVLINTVEAPLLYVSPTQVNGQVPFGTHLGRGGVIVKTGLGMTSSVPADFTEAAPELFLFGENQAIVLNSDFTLNTPDNPAQQGSKISVFFTGQGPVDPPVTAGRRAPFEPLSWITDIDEAVAKIGGVDSNVFFIGLAPGFAGLAQADLELPVGLWRQLPIRLTIKGNQSNIGFVSVAE